MRRRELTAAERREHVDTLERLGRLVVALPLAVARYRAFVLLTIVF